MTAESRTHDSRGGGDPPELRAQTTRPQAQEGRWQAVGPRGEGANDLGQALLAPAYACRATGKVPPAWSKPRCPVRFAAAPRHHPLQELGALLLLHLDAVGRAGIEPAVPSNPPQKPARWLCGE
jgi:hypothetical protein